MWGRFLISGFLGLVAGISAALFMAFGPIGYGGVTVGPWQTSRLIGSADADPVTRAIIARRGLLALNRSEAIYFNADVDDNGAAFDPACTYRVVFDAEPQAEWWSLTLYAEDDFLAVNGNNAHSVTADHAAASAEDPMAAFIAPARGDSPSYWISSANAGSFALTLRMYRPARDVRDDPATANLPRIERLRCEGGA